MAFRIWISTKGKSHLEKISRILGLSLLSVFLIIAGSQACKKKAEEMTSEEGVVVKEGINKFEGVAKVGKGKYLFIPEARGFDIVVQGGDTSVLVGKEIRGEGEFSAERISILVANSIDVKDSEGDWRNAFTRTEEVVLDDFLDLKEREEFQLLEKLSYENKQGWEGKEKGKVYGKLEKKAVAEGGEQKEAYNIVILDEEGKETGKIIVDNFTDYALYYMKKLRLFDKFYFYITVKDTVDWKARRENRELFHADVFFTGLY